MSSVIAGKYEVLEELGASAAGTTYKVRHTLLDSIFTLTVLPDGLSQDPARLGRVQRAVRSAFELKHDHIVRLLDLGCEGDRYHLVEAFAEADTLEHALRQRRAFSAGDALQLAWQLADALAYAHERGVVHGALTPANVLVERAAVPRVLLSGFVVAAVAASEHELVPALAGYTAPERLAAADGAQPDPRSDVFALGLLLFEMLEGTGFFAGKSPDAIADILRDTSGPLLPRFSRIAPSGVSAVVARAIRRAPADRQQGMTQLRRELDACLQRLDRSPGETSVAVDVTPSVPAPPPKSVETPVQAPRAVESRGSVPKSAESAVRRPVTVITPRAPRPEPVDAPMAEASRDEAVAVRPSRGRPIVVGSAAVAFDESMPNLAPEQVGMTAERIVARQLLAAAGVRPGVRRRIPVASGALVLVALVFGWLVFRPSKKMPAAPTEIPAVAEVAPAATPSVVAATAKTARVEPSPVAAAPLAPSEDGMSEPPAVQEQVALARPPVAPEPPMARDLPPRITKSRPGKDAPVNVLEGSAVDFSVTATDGTPAGRLAYAWSLDGERVSKRPTWRFVAPPASTGTTHQVEVEVTDGAGQKAPLSWSIAVSPRMTEANVREWLARLATAWERKDVAALRLYGIVTNDDQADEVRRWVSRHAGYHVAFREETIRAQGQYASVAVDRVDLDGAGRTISSRRESYELEKRASGFIVLRAR